MQRSKGVEAGQRIQGIADGHAVTNTRERQTWVLIKSDVLTFPQYTVNSFSGHTIKAPFFIEIKLGVISIHPPLSL